MKKLTVLSASVLLALVVAVAGCPKKGAASASSADAGVAADPHSALTGQAPPLDTIGGPPKMPKSHDELLDPHGVHETVSKSAIATLPMTAPVVTVNETTFTRADLERSISQHAVVAGIPPGNLDAQTRDALEQPAYDKMIERKLLSDEARRRNLWPTDDEVKKQRDQMVSSLPAGKTMADMLKAMNSDEKQFNDDIASDVAIGKLFEAMKKEEPPPDDAKLKKIYDDNKDKFVVPDTASAMHILVKVPREAKPEEVKAALDRAKAIRKEVAGKDEATFKKVAADKSEDPSAKQNGGDMGTFAKGDMVKEFEEAAFKLKPGELSEPIRTDFGWHIIRGGGQKKGGQKSFAEMKQMIADREGVKGFMDKVDGLIDGLRAKAKITRIVQPLPSPFSQEDEKGTHVPAWKPGANNAKPGSANPHTQPPPMPPGAVPG
ncbi:MAG TPA: peptidylprolyl isomerase [Myxococcota bacterium]|jgi:peptidyl-prolyl cis-trans isomerase C